MNSQVVTRNIVVSCGDASCEGTLMVHEFSARERWKRAVKTGVLCFGVLLGVACIPAAHFVLVPLVLILSPWIIVRSFQVSQVIKDADIHCARCQGELTRVSTRESYPMYETCLSCKRENVVSLAGATTSNTTLSGRN